MHRTDKYSQHSSIIWPVWLNGRVFVYELSGVGSSPVAETHSFSILIDSVVSNSERAFKSQSFTQEIIHSRDHSFSTYKIFSEKLTFLTP